MSGRHRKLRPSSTAAIRLARTSALTVMATAPLAVVTSGSALADTGTDSDAPSWAQHHAGTRWDDRDSLDRTASHDSSDSDSSDAEGTDYSDDADDSGDTDYSDAVDDAPGWARGSSGSRSGSSASEAKWDRMARCESGQNWDADTGNGYKGGLQFSDSTWRSYGGWQYAPTADQASREQQIAVAKKVQREQGWQAWPSCSQQMGYA
jgi:hypothetical protein